MKYLASIIGLIIAVFVVIAFSTFVYGGVALRPWWTTIIGIGIWFLVTYVITQQADRINNDQKIINNMNDGECPICGADIKTARERCPDCDELLTDHMS